MNMSQMAVQQQIAIHQEDDVKLSQPPTHNYNLRRCTTKQRVRISLAIVNESTGVKEKRQYMTIYPKVHAHMTQMNIRKDYKTLVRKGMRQFIAPSDIPFLLQLPSHIAVEIKCEFCVSDMIGLNKVHHGVTI